MNLSVSKNTNMKKQGIEKVILSIVIWQVKMFRFFVFF